MRRGSVYLDGTIRDHVLSCLGLHRNMSLSPLCDNVCNSLNMRLFFFSAEEKEGKFGSGAKFVRVWRGHLLDTDISMVHSEDSLMNDDRSGSAWSRREGNRI